MRKSEKGDVLAVRAIGGLHVVTIAWDFLEGQDAKRKGLLGFAIERSELKQGKVIECYFLRGIKRFKSKDEGLPPGMPVPTSEHPIQSFQWGDYTVKPATTYRYKVIPVYGQPKLLDLEDGSATMVEIPTESEQGQPDKNGHAKYPGKVLTQRQLLNEVWGPNRLDQAQYLRVYIAQLRRKLESDPARPKYLQTEPGIGYRLNIDEQ